MLKAMPHILSVVPDIKLYVVGDFGKDKGEYIELHIIFKVTKDKNRNIYFIIFLFHVILYHLFVCNNCIPHDSTAKKK